jgi:uncharacterized membrane protein (DUF2068 family)
VLATPDAGTLGGVRDAGAGSGIVTFIGVFKLVKMTILLTLGLWALTEGHEQVAHDLARLTRWTGAFSGREVFQHALARLLSLDNREIHRVGVASIVYAVVFAIEGAGLISRRTWAEWLTVGVTASFVPLEVYELLHRPGPAKAAALMLNLLIVAYLARRRLAAP